MWNESHDEIRGVLGLADDINGGHDIPVSDDDALLRLMGVIARSRKVRHVIKNLVKKGEAA